MDDGHIASDAGQDPSDGPHGGGLPDVGLSCMSLSEVSPSDMRVSDSTPHVSDAPGRLLRLRTAARLMGMAMLCLALASAVPVAADDWPVAAGSQPAAADRPATAASQPAAADQPAAPHGIGPAAPNGIGLAPPDGIGLTATDGIGPAAPDEVPPLGEPGFSLQERGQFGVTGQAYRDSPNQLNVPVALAAQDDTVWIAEASGLRLLRFDSTGRFVEQVGAPGDPYALPGGPTYTLTDIAVGPDGSLWLASADGSVTQRLPDGSVGVQLDAGDGLSVPVAVTLDDRGNIYVSNGPSRHAVDAGDHTVRVFDPTGSPLAVIGQPGVPGTGANQFHAPAGLVLDHTRKLYVADTHNHRVQIFDLADPAGPAAVGTWGTSGQAGTAEGQFDRPTGLGVDNTFVYVADSGNCRVQLIARTTGRHFATIGTGCGTGPGQLDEVADAAVDADGNIYVADSGSHRVLQYLPRRELAMTLGTSGVPYVADSRHHNRPVGVAIAADGGHLVAETAGHRVVRRDAFGIGIWTFGSAGSPGEGDVRLDSPSDVDLDASGAATVADSGNGRLVRLTADGDFDGSLGESGLTCPAALDPLPDGGYLVAEPCRHAVVRVAQDGAVSQFTGRQDQPGSGPDTLRGPEGVAVGPSGQVAVADTGNHRVLELAPDGARVRTLGAPGTPGNDFAHFDGPTRVAYDAEGRLYVADTGNHRIQVFDPEGGYLTTVGGIAGGASGAFRGPQGLAAAGGRLLVADRDNHRVVSHVVGVSYWRQDNLNGFGEPIRRAVTALTGSDAGVAAAVTRAGGVEVLTSQDPAWWSSGWDASPGPAGVQSVTALTTTNEGLLAATESGLHARAAGGTWTAVPDVAGEVTLLAGGLNAHWAGAVGSGGSVGAQLYRSESGAPGTWALAGPAGLGDPDNAAVSALAVHRDTVYVGTSNAAGAQIWGSSGGGWSQVASEGFGSPENRGIGALTAFSDTLYAATVVEPDSDAGLEVYRCQTCDGSDWTRVARGGVGPEAPKGPAGFAVLRESDELEFLYLAVGRPTGLEVWRTRDGDEWEVLGRGGFGDANNGLPGFGAVTVASGRVVVGTQNLAHGGELWSTAGTRPGQGPTVPGPDPLEPPEEPEGRVRYEWVTSWPPTEGIPRDVPGNIVDMALGADGSIYLADAFANRVLVVTPQNTWGEPIGGTGRGPERIGRIGSVAVDDARDRLYVGDHAAHRLVVYGLDGDLREIREGVHPQGMVVLDDGQLIVADDATGSVRFFAADGTEQQAFGRYGSDDELNEFSAFGDVTMAPDGTLYVSDEDGDRLRIYRPQGGTFVRHRTLDLTSNRFWRRNQPRCDGGNLAFIGGEQFLAGACVIDAGRLVDHAPTAYPAEGLRQIRLWTAGPGGFAALATLDPDQDTDQNPVHPTVLRLADPGFRVVADMIAGTNLADLGGTFIAGPERLSATPGGNLSLSDGYGLREMDPDGVVAAELGLSTARDEDIPLFLARNLAVAEGREERMAGIAGSWRAPTQVLYGETVNQQFCADGRCTTSRVIESIWTSSAPRTTTWFGAVAHEPTENQFLLLRRNQDQPGDFGAQTFRLSAYPLGWFGRRSDWVLPGTLRDALWADVEAGNEGTIQVLDVLGDRVQALDPQGEARGTLATPKDAYRVAVGPRGEPYLLTVYGHVVRLAADGTEKARFDVRPHEGLSPTSLMDIAVDARGWVYAVDEDARQVAAYKPAGEDKTVLEGERCQVLPDKTAAPKDVLLGDPVRVTLQLEGTCGWAEQASDIVVAVNTGGQRQQLPAQVTRQIVALTDLDRHRVGIVSYFANANVESPLTQDTQQLINAMRVLDAGRGVESNERVALSTASQLFDPDSGRRRVIILVGPSYCPPDEQSCGEITDGESLAEELRDQGVKIVVVNGANDAGFLASSSLDVVVVAPDGNGAGRVAHQRISERLHPGVLATTAVVTDRLPANMGYVTDSAVPPAAWDAASRTLTWNLADLDYAPTQLAFEVIPTETGEWPTNASAAARFTDGWNNDGSVVFPVPRVRVFDPTAPTPTPAPPEPGVAYLPRLLWTQPPVKPPPAPLFLPYASNGHCRPTDRHVDVALVIDTSVSMGDPTRDGGESKLEAAVLAARSFVGLLNFPQDQAAIVQFNTDARVITALSDDRQAALDGLDALSQTSGTRIDLGLAAATAELTGPAARQLSTKVIILLSDGEHSGESEAPVLAASQSAKNAGILIYTIALGQDVDTALLEAVATGPHTTFVAPDTADLERIYAAIAVTIPCR